MGDKRSIYRPLRSKAACPLSCQLVVGSASPSARRSPDPLACGRLHIVQIGLRQYASGENPSHKLVQKGGQKVNLRSL
ncbi:hypothetical protein [Sphingomonas sp. BK069]|uniref:hypothetical protein n=1 Tax=Sphingomonas sp. BK069 TaxID=2586979 RepID=UPI00160B703E|nr:hypothetical protein [Sphingomonas sp. BK069]MBB3349475.1 hypothetical protein [Sphingomonas sp. BK069]